MWAQFVANGYATVILDEKCELETIFRLTFAGGALSKPEFMGPMSQNSNRTDLAGHLGKFLRLCWT